METNRASAIIFTVGRDIQQDGRQWAIYDGAARVVGGYRVKRTALEEAARMSRESAGGRRAL